MNEPSIRERLRKAIGETDYMPGLAGRVRARLGEPSSESRQSAPRLLAFVAALLAVIIVGTLVYVGQSNRAKFTPIPSTSPSPSASPTPSGPAAFAGPCKLAIAWGGTTDQALGGGFIAFPGAGFTVDPQAHMSKGGEYWLTYNTTRHQWLPVLEQFASPDGTKFLYFTLATGTLMWVTDSTTGQGYALQNDGINWSPVGMDNSGAYAMGENRVGLWRLPFQVGPPVKIVADGWWVAISGTFAWGFASPSVPVGASTVLERLDLSTGSIKSFATFGDPVQVIGFDKSGLPVLWTAQSGSITTLSSSGAETTIATKFPLANAPNFSPNSPYVAVGDDNGLWLAGTDGVYLYSRGTMRKLSNVIGIPASGCV